MNKVRVPSSLSGGLGDQVGYTAPRKVRVPYIRPDPGSAPAGLRSVWPSVLSCGG